MTTPDSMSAVLAAALVEAALELVDAEENGPTPTVRTNNAFLASIRVKAAIAEVPGAPDAEGVEARHDPTCHLRGAWSREALEQRFPGPPGAAEGRRRRWCMGRVTDNGTLLLDRGSAGLDDLTARPECEQVPGGIPLPASRSQPWSGESRKSRFARRRWTA